MRERKQKREGWQHHVSIRDFDACTCVSIDVSARLVNRLPSEIVYYPTVWYFEAQSLQKSG